MEKKMKVDILGTIYTVTEATPDEDKYLIECDGYCDKTSKKIVIAAKDERCELDDFIVYQKKVKRHEIIHAFLIESGIQENYKNNECGHDEIMVDWFAIQFPKLQKAFYEADCL